MKMVKHLLAAFCRMNWLKYGKVEQAPKLEGKRMIMLLNAIAKENKVVTNIKSIECQK